MIRELDEGYVVVPVVDELIIGRARQHQTSALPGESAIDTERRRRSEMHAGRPGPIRGVGVSDELIGGVAVRLFSPSNRGEPLPCLIWLHGGGWIYGSNDGDDVMLSTFALHAEMAVASVNYRLAPEHPYPAALDDANDVFRALTSGWPGIDPRRVLIGGASAGATIAAGLSLRLRDRGTPPHAQFLICPPIDDRAVHDDAASPFSRSQMSEFWRAYTAGSTHPYAVPGRADDLQGLPRTYIFTTSADPLRMEAWDYSTRLAAAGVEVETQFLPGGYHGFEYEVPDAALSQRAVKAWTRVLRALGSDPESER